jgi:hypothetical protein
MRATAAGFFISITVALFAGLWAMQLYGYRVGTRWARAGRETEGTGAVEGALFALLGLMFAFTFAGAQSRLDMRRGFIVDEANAIGTAYLRVDLLPPAAQARVRDRFKRYVESRIAYYKELPDLRSARAEHVRSVALQGEIWKESVAATGAASDPNASLLVLPALNEMFDVTTKRQVALRTHTPPVIYVLLALLALACAFFAGIGMARARRRSLLHVAAFAATLALTFCVMLDLEFPRVGLIQITTADRLLGEVRAGMD